MIGKRFRSLPFIFANDNYTLSARRRIFIREAAQQSAGLSFFAVGNAAEVRWRGGKERK